MNIHLTLAEKQFLHEVMTDLKQYQIHSKDRRNIRLQLLEHIQAAREHGQDSIQELGEPATFVKDFLELNGIDLHSKMKQIQKFKSRPGLLWVTGVCSFILAYLCSQLILSMFLTEAFNPQKTYNSFDYHIFYRISEHSWWNVLLMMISISASLLVSALVVFSMRKIKGYR